MSRGRKFYDQSSRYGFGVGHRGRPTSYGRCLSRNTGWIGDVSGNKRNLANLPQGIIDATFRNGELIGGGIDNMGLIIPPAIDGGQDAGSGVPIPPITSWYPVGPGQGPWVPGWTEPQAPNNNPNVPSLTYSITDAYLINTQLYVTVLTNDPDVESIEIKVGYQQFIPYEQPELFNTNIQEYVDYTSFGLDISYNQDIIIGDPYEFSISVTSSTEFRFAIAFLNVTSPAYDSPYDSSAAPGEIQGVAVDNTIRIGEFSET